MATRDETDTIDELLRAAAHAPEHALPIDAPTPEASRPAPATLGTVDRESYRVVGEHARGGMGRILVAQQSRLGRIVAVKELLVRDRPAEVRFVREALLTARLEHPSIIPVHDAGHWPTGEPFYVMKLISGRPLGQLIAEKHTMRERLALLPTVMAASDAVAYAHSRRVIHRDLKPSNILAGEFGETVVIDWGLGKTLESDPSLPGANDPELERAATQAGEVVGTPDFMSPEQAAGRALDERADVYALGAILYVLLAGRPPYDGKTPYEIIKNVLAGPPEPLQARVRGVPLDLLAIVNKAMARDPLARYQTAAELTADLRRFQAGQLVAAYRYSRRVRLRRWAARHPALVTALLVGTLVGAIAILRVIAERDRAERERTVAEQALAREAATNDRAALVQARQLLEHDPTASLSWLRRLRPSFPNWEDARKIAAEAAERGVAERILDVGSPVVALECSRDGKWLVTAGEDGRVRRWRASDGSVEELAHAENIRQLALSPDEKWLALAAKAPLLVGLETRVATPLVGEASAVAFSPDGTRLAIGGPSSQLLTLDDKKSLPLPAGTLHLEFAPDGKRLVVRAHDRVHLVDALGGAEQRLANPALPGEGLARFSPDGKWLAAAGFGEVRLWDLASGTVHSLAAEGEIVDISFSQTRLASASSDGAVRWWELPGLRSNQLAHAGTATRELTLSSDGASLLVTRGDNLRVYSLPGGRVRKLRGHTMEISEVRFLSQNRAASASLDGTVRLWRLDALSPPADPARLHAWLDWAAPPSADSN